MTAMRLLLDCYWRAAEVTGWFLLRPEIWSSWLRSGSAGYEIVNSTINNFIRCWVAKLG